MSNLDALTSQLRTVQHYLSRWDSIDEYRGMGIDTPAAMCPTMSREELEALWLTIMDELTPLLLEEDE